MNISELPYTEEIATLFKKNELPLVHLVERLAEVHPSGRCRALIVANDAGHKVFNDIVGSRLYDPTKMTLTLISPKDKDDLIGQCCRSNRCHDYIFLSTDNLDSEMCLTTNEVNLLKTQVFCF